MIHNPQMECMDRESMRKLQSERLIKTVKTCYEKVPFYKKKMDHMGVKPEDIRSIDDIYKLPSPPSTTCVMSILSVCKQFPKVKFAASMLRQARRASLW